MASSGQSTPAVAAYCWQGRWHARVKDSRGGADADVARVLEQAPARSRAELRSLLEWPSKAGMQILFPGGAQQLAPTTSSSQSQRVVLRFASESGSHPVDLVCDGRWRPVLMLASSEGRPLYVRASARGDAADILLDVRLPFGVLHSVLRLLGRAAVERVTRFDADQLSLPGSSGAFSVAPGPAHGAASCSFAYDRVESEAERAASEAEFSLLRSLRAHVESAEALRTRRRKLATLLLGEIRMASEDAGDTGTGNVVEGAVAAAQPSSSAIIVGGSRAATTTNNPGTAADVGASSLVLGRNPSNGAAHLPAAAAAVPRERPSMRPKLSLVEPLGGVAAAPAAAAAAAAAAPTAGGAAPAITPDPAAPTGSGESVSHVRGAVAVPNGALQQKQTRHRAHGGPGPFVPAPLAPSAGAQHMGPGLSNSTAAAAAAATIATAAAPVPPVQIIAPVSLAPASPAPAAALLPIDLPPLQPLLPQRALWSGRWVVDKSRSDSLELFLKHIGVGYLLRKVLASVEIIATWTHVPQGAGRPGTVGLLPGDDADVPPADTLLVEESSNYHATSTLHVLHGRARMVADPADTTKITKMSGRFLDDLSTLSRKETDGGVPIGALEIRFTLPGGICTSVDRRVLLDRGRTQKQLIAHTNKEGKELKMTVYLVNSEWTEARAQSAPTAPVLPLSAGPVAAAAVVPATAVSAAGGAVPLPLPTAAPEPAPLPAEPAADAALRSAGYPAAQSPAPPLPASPVHPHHRHRKGSSEDPDPQCDGGPGQEGQDPSLQGADEAPSAPTALEGLESEGSGGQEEEGREEDNGDGDGDSVASSVDLPLGDGEEREDGTSLAPTYDTADGTAPASVEAGEISVNAVVRNGAVVYPAIGAVGGTAGAAGESLPSPPGDYSPPAEELLLVPPLLLSLGPLPHSPGLPPLPPASTPSGGPELFPGSSSTAATQAEAASERQLLAALQGAPDPFFVSLRGSWKADPSPGAPHSGDLGEVLRSLGLGRSAPEARVLISHSPQGFSVCEPGADTTTLPLSGEWRPVAQPLLGNAAPRVRTRAVQLEGNGDPGPRWLGQELGLFPLALLRRGQALARRGMRDRGEGQARGSTGSDSSSSSGSSSDSDGGGSSTQGDPNSSAGASLMQHPSKPPAVMRWVGGSVRSPEFCSGVVVMEMELPQSLGLLHGSAISGSSSNSGGAGSSPLDQHRRTGTTPQQQRMSSSAAAAGRAQASSRGRASLDSSTSSGRPSAPAAPQVPHTLIITYRLLSPNSLSQEWRHVDGTGRTVASATRALVRRRSDPLGSGLAREVEIARMRHVCELVASRRAEAGLLAGALQRRHEQRKLQRRRGGAVVVPAMRVGGGAAGPPLPASPLRRGSVSSSAPSGLDGPATPSRPQGLVLHAVDSDADRTPLLVATGLPRTPAAPALPSAPLTCSPLPRESEPGDGADMFMHSSVKQEPPPQLVGEKQVNGDAGEGGSGIAHESAPPGNGNNAHATAPVLYGAPGHIHSHSDHLFLTSSSSSSNTTAVLAAHGSPQPDAAPPQPPAERAASSASHAAALPPGIGEIGLPPYAGPSGRMAASSNAPKGAPNYPTGPAPHSRKGSSFSSAGGAGVDREEAPGHRSEFLEVSAFRAEDLDFGPGPHAEEAVLPALPASRGGARHGEDSLLGPVLPLASLSSEEQLLGVHIAASAAHPPPAGVGPALVSATTAERVAPATSSDAPPSRAASVSPASGMPRHRQHFSPPTAAPSAAAVAVEPAPAAVAAAPAPASASNTIPPPRSTETATAAAPTTPDPVQGSVPPLPAPTGAPLDAERSEARSAKGSAPAPLPTLTLLPEGPALPRHRLVPSFPEGPSLFPPSSAGDPLLGTERLAALAALVDALDIDEEEEEGLLPAAMAPGMPGQLPARGYATDAEAAAQPGECSVM